MSIAIILGTDALTLGFFWIGLALWFRAVDKRETKELLQRMHAMDEAYQYLQEQQEQQEQQPGGMP